MKWRIDFSPRASKFARKNKLTDTVKELILKFLRARRGDNNIPDTKYLKGKWKGYYRIRKAGIRIIFQFDNVNKMVYIEAIDWRNKAYRK